MKAEPQPDFRLMLKEMHAAGLTDDHIADELAYLEVLPNVSSITSIRLGRTKQPKYALGAALMSVYLSWKNGEA